MGRKFDHDNSEYGFQHYRDEECLRFRCLSSDKLYVFFKTQSSWLDPTVYVEMRPYVFVSLPVLTFCTLADIVLGSGISYVLSNAESQQVSCGIIDYISVSNPADKDAIETMNVIQFDKTSRGDCGIPFGQDSGYGFELLPSKCYYASFKLPKQGDFQLRIDREEWASCLIYNHW